jgi:hypothetical protein
MTTSYDDVDQLLVLIDVDDPATRDTEFLGYLRYGGFVKRMAEFSEENRALAREMEGILANKFAVELYMDKFTDFLFRCLPSQEVRRSLTFKTFYMSLDPDEDIEDGELAYVYELKTVGQIELPTGDDTFAYPDSDDEMEVPTVLH